MSINDVLDLLTTRVRQDLTGHMRDRKKKNSCITILHCCMAMQTTNYHFIAKRLTSQFLASSHLQDYCFGSFFGRIIIHRTGK